MPAVLLISCDNVLLILHILQWWSQYNHLSSIDFNGAVHLTTDYSCVKFAKEDLSVADARVFIKVQINCQNFGCLSKYFSVHSALSMTQSLVSKIVVKMSRILEWSIFLLLLLLKLLRPCMWIERCFWEFQESQHYTKISTSGFVLHLAPNRNLSYSEGTQ